MSSTRLVNSATRAARQQTPQLTRDCVPASENRCPVPSTCVPIDTDEDPQNSHSNGLSSAHERARCRPLLAPRESNHMLKAVLAPEPDQYRHLRETLIGESFDALTCVAMTGDGCRIIAGTLSGELRSWRASDHALMIALKAHTGEVTWRTAETPMAQTGRPRRRERRIRVHMRKVHRPTVSAAIPYGCHECPATGLAWRSARPSLSHMVDASRSRTHRAVAPASACSCPPRAMAENLVATEVWRP